MQTLQHGQFDMGQRHKRREFTYKRAAFHDTFFLDMPVDARGQHLLGQSYRNIYGKRDFLSRRFERRILAIATAN